MAIQLKPFKVDHLLNMNIQASQSTEVNLFEAHAQYQRFEDEYSFTMFDDDLIIGCGGATEIFPHNVTIWMVFSEHLSKYKRPMIQAIRSNLELVENQYGRIQVYVQTKNTNALRFVEFFGFEYEGTLRNFLALNNRYEDVAVYAKIRGK